MAYEVLRVPSVGRVVSGMTGRERRAYEVAVQALRGEGCRGGGKRLSAVGGDDYPMCQRSLYGPWRLTAAFRPDDSIGAVARVGDPTWLLANTLGCSDEISFHE